MGFFTKGEEGQDPSLPLLLKFFAHMHDDVGTQTQI